MKKQNKTLNKIAFEKSTLKNLATSKDLLGAGASANPTIISLISKLKKCPFSSPDKCDCMVLM